MFLQREDFLETQRDESPDKKGIKSINSQQRNKQFQEEDDEMPELIQDTKIQIQDNIQIKKQNFYINNGVKKQQQEQIQIKNDKYNQKNVNFIQNLKISVDNNEIIKIHKQNKNQKILNNTQLNTEEVEQLEDIQEIFGKTPVFKRDNSFKANRNLGNSQKNNNLQNLQNIGLKNNQNSKNSYQNNNNFIRKAEINQQNINQYNDKSQDQKYQYLQQIQENDKIKNYNQNILQRRNQNITQNTVQINENKKQACLNIQEQYYGEINFNDIKTINKQKLTDNKTQKQQLNNIQESQGQEEDPEIDLFKLNKNISDINGQIQQNSQFLQPISDNKIINTDNSDDSDNEIQNNEQNQKINTLLKLSDEDSEQELDEIQLKQSIQQKQIEKQQYKQQKLKNSQSRIGSICSFNQIQDNNLNQNEQQEQKKAKHRRRKKSLREKMYSGINEINFNNNQQNELNNSLIKMSQDENYNNNDQIINNISNINSFNQQNSCIKEENSSNQETLKQEKSHSSNSNSQISNSSEECKKNVENFKLYQRQPSFDFQIELEDILINDKIDMKSFLTQPIIKGLKIKCTIQRENSGVNYFYPKYHVYTTKKSIHLMSARKRACNSTSNYSICMDQRNMDKKSEYCIGKVRSNFLGTVFNIYDDGENPKKAKKSDKIRSEFGNIVYETKFSKQNNPRQMKVILPEVKLQSELQEIIDNHQNYYSKKQTNIQDWFGQNIEEQINKQNQVNMVSTFQPIKDEDQISYKYNQGIRERIQTYHNKQPQWNEFKKQYMLDYKERQQEILSSTKNFQLISDNDQENTNRIYLSFGKIGKSMFSMDFCWPLSPLQAFGICITALDNKLGLE